MAAGRRCERVGTTFFCRCWRPSAVVSVPANNNWRSSIPDRSAVKNLSPGHKIPKWLPFCHCWRPRQNGKKGDKNTRFGFSTDRRRLLLAGTLTPATVARIHSPVQSLLRRLRKKSPGSDVSHPGFFILKLTKLCNHCTIMFTVLTLTPLCKRNRYSPLGNWPRSMEVVMSCTCCWASTC